MKRLISLFLSIVMLLSITAGLNLTVFANTSGDFEYELLADGTAEITYYSGSETNVTIPSKLDGYTVTSIGKQAFGGCVKLNSLTIADTVTNIGDAAFELCAKLTDIRIGKNVANIDNSVGYYSPFVGCINLKIIDVAANNQFYSSQDGVLFNKSKTELIQYPAGNERTEYTIPNSVTSIDTISFHQCSRLAKVTIPESVTNISYMAFSVCYSITSIDVAADNQFYSSQDGVLFNKSKTELIQYPIGNKRTSYIMPISVRNISDGAFAYADSLISTIIPNGVASIPFGAFVACFNLTNIVIPNSVTSIGGNAFLSCISLSGITIPKSVTSIGLGAFDGCIALSEVYYPGTQSDWNKISTDSGNACLTNATIHFEQANDNNSVLVAPNGFTLQKNNNKFIHYNCLDENGNLYPENQLSVKYSDCGFLGKRDHSINNDLLKAQLYNLSYTNGRLSLIQNQMKATWGGSCYGIAATIGLTYNNILDVNDISTYDTNDYYSAKFPYENQQLSDAIEFYYLSQFLNGYGTDSKLCTSGIKNVFVNNKYIDEWNSYFLFLDDYYKLLINDISKNSTMLLGYFHMYKDSEGKLTTSGHAIITCGMEQLNDGTYDIWLYDENCINHFDHLYLKDNNGKFDVKYKCGNDFTTLPDEIMIMYHIPLDNYLGNIYPLKNSRMYNSAAEDNDTVIIFNANNSFDLDNSKNENIISYNGEEIESDYNIKDFRVIANDTENNLDALYEITIDKEDDFTYTSSDADTDITIFDNYDYASIKGKNIDGISISGLDTVNLKGTDYTFEASVNRNVNSENQLVSITANANGDVTLNVDENNEIHLSSDDKITDVKIVLTDNDGSKELETDDSKTIKICAEGHDFKDNVIAPTCTEKGYTTHTCSLCNVNYTDNYIDETGHIVVTDTTVTATCTTAGKTVGSHCSVCGTVITAQKTVAATGHSYNNGKVTKSATCTNAGTKTYTCTVCGETKTETIPATGHAEVIDKAVSTTYTATGLTQGSHCSVCGTVITPQTVVAKKKPTIKKLTKAKKSFKLSWKKVSGITGYEIQYSTSKKFTKKTTKTATVKGAKKTSATVKKLKAKKTYYVRIRTYKTIKGKKVYSSWSAVKSVKTK